MVAVGSDLYVFGGLVSLIQVDVEQEDLFYRFSTTTLQWKKLDAYAVGDARLPEDATFWYSHHPNSSPPSNRRYHGMTAVGSSIYVFGGEAPDSQANLDLMVYVTPQVITFPTTDFSAAWLTRVYDGDIIRLTGDADWPAGLTVELCVSVLPCSLTIAGDLSSSSTIRRHTDSRIVCEAASGCTEVTMRHVAVACTSELSETGPLQISGSGAVGTIEGAAFSDCSSLADGGCIRAYNGAAVKISGTTFQRSSSQVPFMSCHSCTPAKCIGHIRQPDTHCLYSYRLNRHVLCHTYAKFVVTHTEESWHTEQSV